MTHTEQREKEQPKTYTELRGDARVTWGEIYDTDENSLPDVLGVLSQEFRTFGQGLVAIMEAKLGRKVPNPQQRLSKACDDTGVDLDLIATRNTLGTWFENVNQKDKQGSAASRPRKSESSRSSMFAFAFAMQLTVPETNELFRKVYLDRAYNQRDYKELIYYYCLSRQLSFSKAQEMIREVRLSSADQASDKTVYTRRLEYDELLTESEKALVAFIEAHSHNFMINTRSAMQVKHELIENAKEIAKNEGKIERAKYTAKKLTSDRYIEKGTGSADDPENALKKEARKESYTYRRNLDSNDYLYDHILDRKNDNSVAGKTGTITLPFKNSLFPSEIKSRFPQPGTLSKKNLSSEELRKVIILLFSYCFWQKMKKCDDCDWRYRQYVAQMDDWLTKAKLPLMYYGNPYDWMFLFCSTTASPLETFRSLVREALGEKDDDSDN